MYYNQGSSQADNRNTESGRFVRYKLKIETHRDRLRILLLASIMIACLKFYDFSLYRGVVQMIMCLLLFCSWIAEEYVSVLITLMTFLWDLILASLQCYDKS
jgi:hypothetical protein